MSERQSNHQHVRSFTVVLTPDNIGTGNGKTVKLPMGAVLLRMAYKTVEAFNSVTSDAGTVSDGTTTLVNGVDLQSTGNETVSNVPIHYPTGAELAFTIASVGTAADEGKVIAIGEYALEQGGDFVYG